MSKLNPFLVVWLGIVILAAFYPLFTPSIAGYETLSPGKQFGQVNGPLFINHSQNTIRVNPPMVKPQEKEGLRCPRVVYLQPPESDLTGNDYPVAKIEALDTFHVIQEFFRYCYKYGHFGPNMEAEAQSYGVMMAAEGVNLTHEQYLIKAKELGALPIKREDYGRLIFPQIVVLPRD